MEEARAMTTWLKAGWKPNGHHHFLRLGCGRAGLSVSTEFAAEHADELKPLVVYINSLVNARVYFGAEGSHTL